VGKRLTLVGSVLAAVILFFPACAPGPSATRTPTPTVVYSQYELEYMLLANYSNFFWCDPDFYPVARVGQEEKNSIDQFPDIQANKAEFSAILEQLGLPNKSDYSPGEKLNVYREHKKLTHVVKMTEAGDLYQFAIRVGQGQGQRIVGTISTSGQLSVISLETSFNTCPICLIEGILIDTPAGPARVETVGKGMRVWTVDGSGLRATAAVKATAATSVPEGFQVVTIVLIDGRAVTASPGHPTAEGVALGDLTPGNMLDGAAVVSVKRLNYGGRSTRDLLPEGPTGLYWANGILLRSTLWGR
jgi:hypothetical protein